MDAYSAPWPRPALAASSHDLSDTEFAELDDLLAAIPEPLDPLDAVMLDGFLCGVIVQPQLLATDAWLPYVFDAGGHRWGEAVPGAEQLRARALIERRHRALNRSLAEFGGFDPFVLEPQPAGDAGSEPAGDPAAGPPADPVSEVLAPWVIGFEQALHLFPALVELDEPVIEEVRSRFAAWVPDSVLAGGDAEPGPAGAEPDPAMPAAGARQAPAMPPLEAAIGELVASVTDLYDLTAPLRYKVEAVRREVPKVGRNEPCPCGSGRKFKQCHGAAGAG